MQVKGFKRDGESGALLNTDKASLQAYKESKARANRLNKLESDVKSMKDDMAEIKELLKKALSK